jgi:hypothetical protein
MFGGRTMLLVVLPIPGIVAVATVWVVARAL